MKKIGKPKQNPEGGITLIALVATVIILVVISAVAIRAITGDNDLLATTTEATENYKVAEYKELILAEVAGIIQGNMMKGDGTTLNNIAEGLETNINEVKTANVYEDTTRGNADILVTTEEDYVFEVYYNDLYNVYYVEYCGKGNDTDFPEIKAEYKKTDEKSTITATATAKAGNITNFEITHGGQVVAREKSGSLSDIEITEPGWYEIKVDTNKGKSRYAWLRIGSTSRKYGDTNNKSISWNKRK